MHLYKLFWDGVFLFILTVVLPEPLWNTNYIIAYIIVNVDVGMWTATMRIFMKKLLKAQQAPT